MIKTAQGGNLSRPEVAIHLKISPSKVDADLRAAFRLTLRFLHTKYQK
ncbi:MAG: hypothetical protein ABIH24_09315 [Verrucomicrobiota bacterium]